MKWLLIVVLVFSCNVVWGKSGYCSFGHYSDTDKRLYSFCADHYSQFELDNCKVIETVNIKDLQKEIEQLKERIAELEKNHSREGVKQRDTGRRSYFWYDKDNNKVRLN